MKDLYQYLQMDWDYLLDEAQSGQANMERDLQLLQSSTRPVLRLYCWERPTLSLGYAQRDDWVDYELCKKLDVEVVRRPTGGRALLHMPDEITYAVILPNIGNISVRDAFTAIAGIFSRALARLGVPVGVCEAGHIPSGTSHPSCLAVTAPGEVTARGRKLVGSAQLRRFDGLLQHGSLPRCNRADLLAQVIPGAVPQIDLAELGCQNITPQQIAEAWQVVLKENSAL